MKRAIPLICAACFGTGLSPGAASHPVPMPAASSPASPSLTIGSLNMAKKNSLAEVSDEIAALFERSGVDVLVLQEVDRDVRERDGIAAVLGRRLGLSWQFAPADVWTNREEGLAILSRYPLDAVETIPLKHFDLHGHQRTRIALGATV